jgi:hypothetical protein
MREQMVAMLERLQGVVRIDGETVGRRSDRGFEHLASRQPAAALVCGEQTSDRARDSGGEHAFGVGVVGDDRDAEQSSGALAGDDLVHVGRRGQGRPRRELDREILAAGGVGDEHEPRAGHARVHRLDNAGHESARHGRVDRVAAGVEHRERGFHALASRGGDRDLAAAGRGAADILTGPGGSHAISLSAGA